MKVLLMTIRLIAGLAITGFGLSSCHSNDNNVVTTPDTGTVVSSFYTQSNDQPAKAIDNDRVGITKLRLLSLPHHRTYGFPYSAVESKGC